MLRPNKAVHRKKSHLLARQAGMEKAVPEKANLVSTTFTVNTYPYASETVLEILDDDPDRAISHSITCLQEFGWPAGPAN